MNDKLKKKKKVKSKGGDNDEISVKTSNGIDRPQSRISNKYLEDGGDDQGENNLDQENLLTKPKVKDQNSCFPKPYKNMYN